MLMDFQHGILFFVIGCTVTFVGFFTAFLVVNYNKKKELKEKTNLKYTLMVMTQYEHKTKNQI